MNLNHKDFYKITTKNMKISYQIFNYQKRPIATKKSVTTYLVVDVGKAMVNIEQSLSKTKMLVTSEPFLRPIKIVSSKVRVGIYSCIFLWREKDVLETKTNLVFKSHYYWPIVWSVIV